MASSSQKGYFGITGIVAIILAIIPITSWILGFCQRFADGKPVAGILRILLAFTGIGFLIIWILDIVKMVLDGTIWRVLNC